MDGMQTQTMRGEAVAAILEEDIVLGELHPRQRLVEDELMARFCVKRHIVRDALVKLEQMGLVERRRNVGAIVRGFEAREVSELYELRILLECEAMRRMPLPVSAPDMQALQEVQSRHDDAVENNNLRGVFRANQAFHERLYDLCGNSILSHAIQEYARRTHAIRFGALIALEEQRRSVRIIMRSCRPWKRATEKSSSNSRVRICFLLGTVTWPYGGPGRGHNPKGVSVRRIGCGSCRRWLTHGPALPRPRRLVPPMPRYPAPRCHPSDRDCSRSRHGHGHQDRPP